jgi:FkbM family methyltransferase
MRLNSFRHKGYWYHGKKREAETMQAFSNLIGSGERIVEVGGHIGYITLWLARLAGPTGYVVVFEPGSNNLPYLRRNLNGLPNVTLIEKGCAAESGELEFFEDDLSGQNNSFIPNFKVLKTNVTNAPGIRTKVVNRVASVCRLDSVLSAILTSVDFVKIDTEGYELSVLLGATNLFRQSRPPKFMVEIQEDADAIFKIFENEGYNVYDSSGRKVNVTDKTEINFFMLHPIFHREWIDRWAGIRAL